jgi:hypothetical protein
MFLMFLTILGLASTLTCAFFFDHKSSEKIKETEKEVRKGAAGSPVKKTKQAKLIMKLKKPLARD